MADKPTNIDKLFALKAVEQKVVEKRKDIEYVCREELLAAYEEDGTDRKTSPLFGPDAGKYSIKRMKGSPEREVTEFNLADDVAFADWLEENVGAAISYVKVHASEFAETYIAAHGEVPDGIAVVKHVEPATEGSVSAQVYTFKPDIVLEKLGGRNILEGASRLLGDGDE